jgi:hypothetical protein
MALPVIVHASRRPIPVTIKSRGVKRDVGLHQAVCSSIRSALGRFCRRLRNVFVWIEDTNGPRVGSGMRCRIELSLMPRGRLSVTAEAPSEYAAVALCSERARVILDRHVKKRRHLNRRRASCAIRRHD